MDLSERGWNDLTYNCKALVKCDSLEPEQPCWTVCTAVAFDGRAGMLQKGAGRWEIFQRSAVFTLSDKKGVLVLAIKQSYFHKCMG